MRAKRGNLVNTPIHRHTIQSRGAYTGLHYLGDETVGQLNELRFPTSFEATPSCRIPTQFCLQYANEITSTKEYSLLPMPGRRVF